MSSFEDWTYVDPARLENPAGVGISPVSLFRERDAGSAPTPEELKTQKAVKKELLRQSRRLLTASNQGIRQQFFAAEASVNKLLALIADMAKADPTLKAHHQRLKIRL